MDMCWGGDTKFLLKIIKKTMLFDNDDDASLNSNSTPLQLGPSIQNTDTPIPTAKFIQGRVGMCKRYGKIIKKRYRYGLLGKKCAYDMVSCFAGKQ